MHRLLRLSPFALGSLLLVSCGQETAPTQAEEQPSFAAGGGTWTTKAPMPTPRLFLTAGVVNNSSAQPVLYAIGGLHAHEGVFLRAVEAYNFATNRWSTRAPLRLPLRSTNGVGVIGGKLYLSGGFFDTGDGFFGWHSGLHIYDPAQNTWSKGADMPRRIAQGITGVINGKLYVLTGSCNNCGPQRITRRLYRYDPVTNTWATNLPWAPDAHVSGAGGVINGKFYVAGGTGSDQRDSNRLDMYDPVTNRWTTLAPMPTARSGVAGAVLQNKLYIVGDGNVEPGEPQNQMEAYDPMTNKWEIKRPMPGAGRGDLAAGTVTFGGRSHTLVVGGNDVESSGPGNVNQAFTP
jgi:N-acetylneuraminic acid mutarotase